MITQHVPEGYVAWYRHVRQYAPPVEGKFDSHKQLQSRGGYTVCEIYREGDKLSDGAMPVVTSVAYCNPKDNYNKKIGRAVALGRALKKLESHLDDES